MTGPGVVTWLPVANSGLMPSWLPHHPFESGSFLRDPSLQPAILQLRIAFRILSGFFRDSFGKFHGDSSPPRRRLSFIWICYEREIFPLKFNASPEGFFFGILQHIHGPRVGGLATPVELQANIQMSIDAITTVFSEMNHHRPGCNYKHFHCNWIA